VKSGSVEYYPHDSPRGVLLASFFQEQIHGCKEEDCHMLQQNNGVILSCCYSHITEEIAGNRRKIPTFL